MNFNVIKTIRSNVRRIVAHRKELDNLDERVTTLQVEQEEVNNLDIAIISEVVEKPLEENIDDNSIIINTVDLEVYIKSKNLIYQFDILNFIPALQIIGDGGLNPIVKDILPVNIPIYLNIELSGEEEVSARVVNGGSSNVSINSASIDESLEFVNVSINTGSDEGSFIFYITVGGIESIGYAMYITQL